MPVLLLALLFLGPVHSFASTCYSVPQGQQGDHVVCPPSPTAPPRHELLLFFGGSDSKPTSAIFAGFYDVAASLGFHVVSVLYPDAPSMATACHKQPPSCFLSTRHERLYGEEGGMTRFFALMPRLCADKSVEGWCAFLTPAGNVSFARVVTAGHSQGAGMAVLVSKRVLVAAAVQIAGVDDIDQTTSPPSLVDWILAPGTTPAARLYGLGNGRGFACEAWNANWLHALNMTVFDDVDGTPPALWRGHMLCSHARDGKGGHMAVIEDSQHYRAAWEYMLTRGASSTLHPELSPVTMDYCTCTQ